jgi:hypothetical protein
LLAMMHAVTEKPRSRRGLSWSAPSEPRLRADPLSGEPARDELVVIQERDR